MRLVSIRKLETGQVLGKPVLGPQGRILLQAGVKLTPSYVRRLQQLGLTYVYIQDSETYDIEIVESVSQEVQQEVLTKIKTVYDKMSDPRQSERLIESGELGEVFSKVFKLMFESLMTDDAFILNLTAIYTSDSYLYTHCMNVGTMACILGAAEGYREDRLRKLGLGGMLHDIGKLKIDRDILKKPGKLTLEEWAEVQRHTEFGYQILQKQEDVSAVSAHCALEHHEKFDGTGYPRRLRGTDIHEFGRILAVADVYDALTSNRVYRGAMLPHQAAEYLYAEVGKHFDPHFVTLFMKHINIYPNGLPVQLSSGVEGVVARQNKDTPQRPVVLILAEKGNTEPSYELDLSKELGVTIVACGA